MKHLFFTFVTALLITTSSSQVYAGGIGGIGGSTEVTQILNNVQLLGINVADAATAISTNGVFVNDVILGPIANALIASALQQASNDIISWVNGGFNGDPLIVTNPEDYIKNAGLDEVRIGLGSIPQGALGDSIWTTLYNQYSGSTNLTDQLQGLASSNIPTMVQNSLCTTQALTARATQDVQSSSASYTQADITARINDIYNYACIGDPRTDTQLATRLTDLNQQDSSIMGLEGLAAVTSSENNAYLRTVKAKEYTGIAAAEKKRLAENEIYFGAGTVSEKRCVEYESTPQNGRPPLCLRTETVTPGKVVQASLDKANTAGLERMINIQGAGSLTGLLTNFATQFLISGINRALSPSAQSSYNNAPTTVTSVRPTVQDLTGDPTRKAALLKPMSDQINYYSTALSNLQSVDSLYLTDLLAYETRVQTIRNCAQASAIYTDRQNRINATRSVLSNEVTKISEANQLISTTLARLNVSVSSSEMNTIFNEYLAAVDSRNLPKPQTEAVRRGEYMTNKASVANDTELTNMQNTCAQQQTQTQVP